MFSNEQLTKESVAVIVKAMRRLQQLAGSKILTRDGDAEKQAAMQLVNRAMVAHAPEFLGTWQVMNNEYTPLVQGMAGLLKRAVHINEQEMMARQQAAQAMAAKENVTATTKQQNEQAAAAVTSGEECPPHKRVVVNFGEATKSGAPVETPPKE